MPPVDAPRRPRRRSRRVLSAVVLAALTACTSSSPAGPATSPTSPSTTSVGSPSRSRTSAPPSVAGGAIGYVGCSVSTAAVNGYHLAGGQLLWPGIGDYAGGSVTRWAAGIGDDLNPLWAAFTRNVQSQPTSTFWLQLCVGADENQDNDDEAIAIIKEIHRRVPDAVVYVSPMNDWVAPHVCRICGPDGPENMEVDATEVIATGKALKGPLLPALVADCQDPECGISSKGATPETNEVVSDGCHPDTNGELLLGQRLKRFFG